jgi:4-hydroxybenzoate polyprenyltransferase
MRLLHDLYLFTRFSAFGATAVLPLIGAALAQQPLPPRRIATLLGAAAAFHVFAYVDNDLCDLDLDRGQPLRTEYPLVRGAISPTTARVISLAAVLALGYLAAAPSAPRQPKTQPDQPALPDPRCDAIPCDAIPCDAIPCDAISCDARYCVAALSPHPSAPISVFVRPKTAFERAAPPTILVALLCMAIYNRYGKRCPIPPLTDAIQGVGWAALIAYGAADLRSRPVQWMLLHEVLLILLVNGVHGPLRDLANDEAAGARTTARWFGVRSNAAGVAQPNRALLVYALSLQVGMIGSLVAALQSAVLSPAQYRHALLGVGGSSLVIGAILCAAGRGNMPPMVFGMLHLIAILSAPLTVTAPLLTPPARTALLLAHLAPLSANGLTYEVLIWLYTALSRRLLRSDA